MVARTWGRCERCGGAAMLEREKTDDPGLCGCCFDRAALEVIADREREEKARRVKAAGLKTCSCCRKEFPEEGARRLGVCPKCIEEEARRVKAAEMLNVPPELYQKTGVALLPNCILCGSECEPDFIEGPKHCQDCEAKVQEAVDGMKQDMTEAVKDDDGKLRYDLVPVEALEEIVKVLTFGAGKYKPRNWEKGFDYGRVYAALERHMKEWWKNPGALDEDTKLSHLAHAGCCIFFLLTFEQRGMGKEFDDRPGASYVEEN